MADLTAADVWRDYETDGVASSGEHRPRKADVRQWGGGLETKVASGLANGGLIYTTRAALYADLAHAAPASAWVVGDGTAAYNGVYAKAGASGAGSWSRVADLPFSVIPLSSIGGTATALTATSALPLPTADRAAAITFVAPAASQSGGTTIAINGGSPITIVDFKGDPVTGNSWTAGAVVTLWQVSGALRMTVQGDFSGLAASTQIAAVAAATSADEVAAALAVVEMAPVVGVTDGISAAIDIGYEPMSAAMLAVTLGGAPQRAPIDPEDTTGPWTLSGSVITFADLPPAGLEWVVVGRVAGSGGATITVGASSSGVPIPGAAAGWTTDAGLSPLSITGDGAVAMPGRVAAPIVTTWPAWGADHLALAPADGGSRTYSGFYVLRADPATEALPVQWSPYRQAPSGPIEIDEDRIWAPSPMTRDGLLSTAVYPWPAGARRSAEVDSICHLFIVAGQSLGEGSESGGATVGGITYQCWAAQKIFGGLDDEHGLLEMFNGGLFKPGCSTNGTSPIVADPTKQASLVAAHDSLHVPGSATNTPVTLYDVTGTAIGTCWTHSSSKVLAAMAGLAYGADAPRPFGTTVAGVNLSYGGKPIEYFLPVADGGHNGAIAATWFDELYTDTCANFAAAALAAGKTPRISWIGWDQIQADLNVLTASEYRSFLDILVARFISTARAATGQTTGPIVYQEEATLWCSIGNTYGQDVATTAPIIYATLEKGLSDDIADADFVCTGPAYMWGYIGGFHLQTPSYTERGELLAYVANADAARRALGLGKWKPLHILTDDDGFSRIRFETDTTSGAVTMVVPYHVPEGPMIIDTETIPFKTGWGYELAATTGTPPTILSCEVASNGFELRFGLSGAWSGTGREVRVAYRTSDAAGWRTDDLVPGASWQHQGAGTNVRDSAPWSSRVTGARLANWAVHQIVTIRD